MNNYPQLPKGHTSILSPQFKYVPAASTDLAATFARLRGERVQPQPAPDDAAAWHRPADNAPELAIEVLEASWLTRQQGGRKESEHR
jgi:hypothetical protein